MASSSALRSSCVVTVGRVDQAGLDQAVGDGVPGVDDDGRIEDDLVAADLDAALTREIDHDRRGRPEELRVLFEQRRSRTISTEPATPRVQRRP